MRYLVDKSVHEQSIKGLETSAYRYHQFYDTHDILASNWWQMLNTYKFSDKPKQLPLLFFDIEVDAEEGVFPDPPVAKWAVNSISTFNNVTRELTLFYIPPKSAPERDWEAEIKKLYLETVEQHSEYKIDNIKFIFKRFKDDKVLLAEFWKHVRDAGVIALVGYNSAIFDVPYLVNRTKKLYGKEYKSVISEFGDIRKYGEQFEIPDYSFIDLLHLYKPQSAGGMAFGKAQESYSLDHIANVVLGVGKLEYEGSLVELYTRDPIRFFVYNQFDTVLLHLLNRKLKHIDNLYGLAKFAKTPFTKALVGRSLLYQFDKLFQYWNKGLAVCSKLYNAEISKVVP